jgi:hypothetical protein
VLERELERCEVRQEELPVRILRRQAAPATGCSLQYDTYLEDKIVAHEGLPATFGGILLVGNLFHCSHIVGNCMVKTSDKRRRLVAVAAWLALGIILLLALRRSSLPYDTGTMRYKTMETAQRADRAK